MFARVLSRCLSRPLRAAYHPLTGAIISLCLAPLGQALAETVSFEGRTFQVDTIESLPGDQVTVKIGSRSFLASANGVGQRVFRAYAEEPELLPQGAIDTAYGSFVGTVGSTGAHDDAVVAVRGIIESPRISDGARTSFLTGVIASQSGASLLIEGLRGLADGDGQRQRGCDALSLLPEPSFGNAQKFLSSDMSWASQVCPQFLVKRAQQELLSGEGDRAMRDLSFVVTFFKGQSDTSQAAQISYDRLRTIQDAIAAHDFSKFEAALEGGAFDPLLREYFQRARGDLVTKFCDAAEGQKRFGTVLQGLSVLDFSERNNRHHELALRAIQGLQISDAPVVEAPPVRKMLWAYSAKDPEIKDAYRATLTKFIEQLVDDGYPDKAEALLLILTDIRTDPSSENDLLRGSIAERFVDMNDFADANRILGQLRSQLPWIVRFRLLLKSDTYVLVMVLLGVVVIVRWVAKYVFRAQKRSVTNESAAEGTSETDGEQSSEYSPHSEEKRFKFVDQELTKSTYRGLDEYADCLAKLKLDRSATLADIKNAYRVIAKSLHPDMNPRATRSDLDKFIDLTVTYERLLVLYEEKHKDHPSSPE